MRSKIKCEVCGYAFSEWHTDDSLHSTNWNLPDKRTADVCSVECQTLLLSGYELEQQLRAQRSKGKTKQMKEAILRVREIQVPLAGLEDAEIRKLYYNMQNALELDDE